MKNLPANLSSLYWDLDRERLTLGGAMVLRMEGEIIAKQNSSASIDLYIHTDDPLTSFPQKLVDTVFHSSEILFNVIKGRPEAQQYWPSKDLVFQEDFSYYSFSRLTSLHQLYKASIRLTWNKLLTDYVRQVRARFDSRLVCIHLKRVAPFDASESNADLTEWTNFLVKNNKGNTFVIIGDDPIPSVIKNMDGVICASDISLNLAQQLCLVGMADAFLGMASGICNAANFSEVPHVIFKHPTHHIEDMKRELGEADTFDFANDKQFLWRQEANEVTLHRAFDLIVNS